MAEGMNSIGEILFLQMFLPTVPLNFVTWYLSVLLVAGFAFYDYLECKKGRNLSALCIIFLLALQYLIATYGNLDVNTGDTLFWGQYPGLVRGVAELSVGVFAGTICAHGLQFESPKAWKVIETAIFVFLLADLLVFPHTEFDALFVIASAFLVPISFCNYSYEKQSALYLTISRLSLTMFFSQMIVRQIWWKNVKLHKIAETMNFWTTMLLFTISLVVFSALLELTVQMEKKIVRQIRGKTKQSEK